MAVLRSALLALAVCETANAFVAPAARAAWRASPLGARSRLLDELATLDGDLVDDDEDFAAPEATKSASALAPETLFFEGPPSFTEVIYSDIVDLKYVYRGSKEVGDMVIELRDGAKLEMRHVPKFQDIYKYIYS